jgi:cytochrome c oxidase assembly protein subunit 15
MQHGSSNPGRSRGPWRHRFALFTCLSTLFLIFAGGMVTSTGSGLSVPDWPLSYGEFFPPMVGGIFYEHGHRMVAASVGMLMLALAIWTWRSEERRWVRRLALVALLAVVVQAILGGITVIYLLPTAVSVSHAGLANLFFCMTVVLAVTTGRGWFQPAPPAREPAPGDRRRLRTLAISTTVILYVQILLGAVMRHTQSGLAISDFPLSMGRIIPPLGDPQVAIHFAHRAWAVVVLLVAAVTVRRVLRRHRGTPDLVRPAVALSVLLTAQVILGAFSVWTAKAPVVTTFHVAGGSASLAVALLLSLRSARRCVMHPDPVVSGALATEGSA